MFPIMHSNLNVTRWWILQHEKGRSQTINRFMERGDLLYMNIYGVLLKLNKNAKPVYLIFLLCRSSKSHIFAKFPGILNNCTYTFGGKK